MIPVLQTIFADPARNDGRDAEGVAGNCYQAALASVLELPLAEVPHFGLDADWAEKSWAWLLARGVVRAFYYGEALERFHWPCWDGPGPDELYDGISVVGRVGVIGAGPSPRGAFRHAVVLDPDTGLLAHDPHPSGLGVLEVDELEVLYQAAAP